jgi:hypothetical protein
MIVGTGVDHLLAQEERVEFVRQVVVKLDVVLVVGPLSAIADDVPVKAALIAWGLSGDEQKRRQTVQNLEQVPASDLGRFTPVVDLTAQVDERATRQVDALVDIVADDRIEVGTPQRRRDDTWIADDDL